MKDKTEITLKEVYERLVQLEAKFDFRANEDDRNVRIFKRYIWWLYVLKAVELLAVVFIYYLFFNHVRG